MRSNTFPAKLLLFGEYSIIQGGQALAMPLSLFEASWQWANHESPRPPEVKKHRKRLLEFVSYLAGPEGLGEIDSIAFHRDLKQGLYFDSNIPLGYGLGSSGALCAAVYQAYSKPSEGQLPQLRNHFARMENFFHGSSSGIDPLVSYIRKPILINSQEMQQEGEPALIIPQITNPYDVSPLSLFLLDTTSPRETAPLVKRFISDCENPHYRERLEASYLPLVEEAIEAFIRQNPEALWAAFHQISHFQFQHFSAMIPSEVAPLWLDGLANSVYKLKLCGAGGGGFILGICNDWEGCQRALAGQRLILLSQVT